jgi:hypothetical protein
MRYFSPGMRRFVSEDPIRLGGGINFYAYVENNPTNFLDPLGLWSIDAGIGAQIVFVDATFGKNSDLNMNITPIPGIGAGVFICINICNKTNQEDKCSDMPYGDKPVENVPINYNAGAGRRSSIGVSDDFCSYCINIGPSVGFGPISIGLPIGIE